MKQEISTHVFTGMQLDLDTHKRNSLHLVDAHNIRITARGDTTTLSITNERGPKLIPLSQEIEGTIIGKCVLNNYLVLFTTNNGIDNIYRVDIDDNKETFKVYKLFNPKLNRSLNFDIEHPIETLGSYETELILKVYWVDGKNLPRVINIANLDNGIPKSYDWGGAFDFVPEMLLTEDIDIVREIGSSGKFHSGVILYVFTYCFKNGLETNIFYTSPLYYTSHADRGASPEETVPNIFNISIKLLDAHFDYVRIYAIMRTTLNGEPSARLVSEEYISKNFVTVQGNTYYSANPITIVDDGIRGETVDPLHLLYVGGEDMSAQTITLKDNTLFLGNISIRRTAIDAEIKKTLPHLFGNSIEVEDCYPTVLNKDNNLPIVNGLNTQCAGFKTRETYRLGILFQHKTGRWSEPIYITDKLIANTGSLEGSYGDILNYPLLTNEGILKKPIIKLGLRKNVRYEDTGLSGENIIETLVNLGYVKVRPVIVLPQPLNRSILCLGVLNSTVTNTPEGTLEKQYQSSWFFRPVINNDSISQHIDVDKTVSPLSEVNKSLSLDGSLSILNSIDLNTFRTAEIEGEYKSDWYRVSTNLQTLHSPDIEFSDKSQFLSMVGVKPRLVGLALFKHTYSTLDILTNTPAISNKGLGFISKLFSQLGAYGIVSGLFYDDYAVDDYGGTGQFNGYVDSVNSFKWLVYPWQSNGSINNDIIRPANGGVSSAELKKKIISNLRIADSTWIRPKLVNIDETTPLLFNSDVPSILKFEKSIYQGNIDTMLVTKDRIGKYFCYGELINNKIGSGPDNLRLTNTTSFQSDAWWKTGIASNGLLGGNEKPGLCKLELTSTGYQYWVRKNDSIGDNYGDLATQIRKIRMKYRSTPHIVMKSNLICESSSEFNLPIVELYNSKELVYGGTATNDLRQHTWIPAGEAIRLTDISLSDENHILNIKYTRGDTWYTRYDCLKTYPYTSEDTNQIVEIGSFMLESRYNGDGRYDRNRNLINNLNVSPLNFNLFNPVYSLLDNFFNYKILDDSFYKINEYPCQFTWTLTKNPGTSIDTWTNITLANTLDVEGTLGKIRSLLNYNDTIICFQDHGICQILFNSRVQISTSDNIPIEITNSRRVDGTKYISDSYGCINKNSICKSGVNLYFIETLTKDLCGLTLNFLDISVAKNMTTWFKNNTVDSVFYEGNYKDLYIINSKECLCFNENLLEFTSFMDYNDMQYLFNIKDNTYCIYNNSLYQMFEGEYNDFFGTPKPYSLTFTVNGKDRNLSQLPKIFTNIEFRGDTWEIGTDIPINKSMFDSIEVYNDYLTTGEVLLPTSLFRRRSWDRRFKTWRLDIPRVLNKRDRLRDYWCNITLKGNSFDNTGINTHILLHDVNVVYYI